MRTKRYSAVLAETAGRGRFLSALLTASVAANLLLSCKIASTNKPEKTIVTPPVITQTFWVQGNQVSESYLQMMGDYLSMLLLSYSPTSVQGKVDIALQFVDPSSYAQLKGELDKLVHRVSTMQLSSTFYPTRIRVRVEQNKVAITGNLVEMVSDKVVDRRQVTYRLAFQYRDGRLTFSEFTEATNEQDPFGTPAAVGTPAAASQ